MAAGLNHLAGVLVINPKEVSVPLVTSQRDDIHTLDIGQILDILVRSNKDLAGVLVNDNDLVTSQGAHIQNMSWKMWSKQKGRASLSTALTTTSRRNRIETSKELCEKYVTWGDHVHVLLRLGAKEEIHRHVIRTAEDSRVLLLLMRPMQVLTMSCIRIIIIIIIISI